MRERSLEEFESIFEQASIPVLQVENIALTRLSAVLKGDLLDEGVLDLGKYLAKRFKATLDLYYPATANAELMERAVRDRGLEPVLQPFASTAELVGQLSIQRSQLVLLPEPDREATRVVHVDNLVQGTRPPVLLVRQSIEKPEDVFANILHSLTGHFQQTQNFSYSFTLAEKNSRLLLLHTIEQSDIRGVREALQVSPEITARTGEELLDNLAHHGERFLKGVVAAGHDRPFEISYRLAVGEVVPAVRAALMVGNYSLLVLGSHREGYSHVTAADYQLMHMVGDIPVLAL